jgi:hypothetical protein
MAGNGMSEAPTIVAPSSLNCGCWLGGGIVPLATHCVIATRSARIAHAYCTGFSGCWPAALLRGGNCPGECCVPERKYARTLSGKG